MAAAQTTARGNGAQAGEALRSVPDPGVAQDAATGRAATIGRLASTGVGKVLRRLPSFPAAPVLDDRDPDLVRSALPRLWLGASLWFRSEVRGMGNVPDRGPVLLLGNRSGGSLSPDTVIFALAFSTYFGVERRFHQLVAGLPLTAPAVGLLRGFGILEPTPDNLRAALASGAATLVYPGGPREGRRPTWRSARLQLGHDRDAIAAALEAGVPIVPVVSIGGQETALFLGARLGAIPALPLPAKITIEVLPPIDPVALLGPDPEPEDVHRQIELLMAETLELLAAERRWPILG